MTILSDLERADSLITEDQMANLIKPANELPVASEAELGNAYILVHSEEGRYRAHTYKCIETSDGQFEWKLINYREDGKLDNVTQLWANSVINEDDGTATVKIHWNDPEDKPDAHWAYSMIVKKLGSDPTSPYDGEVVGYSTVRDQYAGKQGFIDTIDGYTITDEDIIDNGEHNSNEPDHTDSAYHYNVFAFTVFGQWTGADVCCGPMLTWEKFQWIVQQGIADHAVELGDLIRVYHQTFGFIDFEVVDFNHAIIIRNGSIIANAPSVTFMSKDVLFRGSFTHINNFSAGQDMDVTQFEGKNVWTTSNIRAWLNSEKDAEHVHEDYDASVPYSETLSVDGAYGDPKTNTLFPGFLGGLPDDLKQVLADVQISTTIPRSERHEDSDHPDKDKSSDFVDRQKDKIFLPSYYEIFGDKYNWPGDHLIAREGQSQFDIYRYNKTNTRMKEILYDFESSDESSGRDWQTGLRTHLASWYLRTPMYSTDVEIGGAPIECVEIVTCKNRRYDAQHELGEDGATGRTPYMPAKSSVGDIARDTASNQFTPTGTRLVFTNNTAPGFAPCFVVA